MKTILWLLIGMCGLVVSTVRAGGRFEDLPIAAGDIAPKMQALRVSMQNAQADMKSNDSSALVAQLGQAVNQFVSGLDVKDAAKKALGNSCEKTYFGYGSERKDPRKCREGSLAILAAFKNMGDTGSKLGEIAKTLFVEKRIDNFSAQQKASVRDHFSVYAKRFGRYDSSKTSGELDINTQEQSDLIESVIKFVKFKVNMMLLLSREYGPDFVRPMQD